jgi:hypothetical protein
VPWDVDRQCNFGAGSKGALPVYILASAREPRVRARAAREPRHQFRDTP